MPILTVIAGPNGAGKSFNSQSILFDQGIHSFDFDFEFNSRWKQYSYDPLVERGVREYVPAFLVLPANTENVVPLIFKSHYF